MVAQILDLLLGRDVQHVDALAGLARELDQPLRRDQRRGLVPPHRMRARVAFDTQRLAVVEAVFVLGVERRAAADHLEDAAQALVVLDQQRPGRRTDEHLYPGAAFRAFQLRQMIHILAGAADEEGEIAMHAMMAGLDLGGERLLGDRERIGVRHFEHRGDAAHHGAARAGLEVFLVGQAGLAEMHLRVHHAGQDVQALAVDHFAGGIRAEPADRGDPPARDADIADTLTVLIDHGAGF